MRFNRRTFIAGAAGVALGRASSPWNVGISTGESDPYQATMRAINCLPGGSFPDVAGRPVGIKVNLVVKKVASTGATTDPQVALAVADFAMSRGASHVYIVEAGQYSNGTPSGPPPFDLCGYRSLFAGRPDVSLIDLDNDPSSPVAVPGGFVYERIHLPATLTQPGMVMMSVAKLKTHVWSVITCATKNWFGLYTPPLYTGPWIARAGPHALGLAQSIVDMHVAVPCRFAVIDGMIGMMGNGPWNGTPIACATVIAGDNPIAADYIAMQAMGLNRPITHLVMAAQKGLGPSAADAGSIQMWGDYLPNFGFVAPHVSWPYSGRPWINSGQFASSQSLNIAITIPQDCLGKVEVVKAIDPQPPLPADVSIIKTLAPLNAMPAKQQQMLTWDGTDDQGNRVSPGMYLIRQGFIIQGADIANQRNYNFGSTFVSIN